MLTPVQVFPELLVCDVLKARTVLYEKQTKMLPVFSSDISKSHTSSEPMQKAFGITRIQSSDKERETGFQGCTESAFSEKDSFPW